MATEVVEPYEILLRFNKSGELSGAHYAKRRYTTLDSGRVVEEDLPLQPLALLEDGARATVAEAIGEATANLAALLTVSQAALAEALAEIAKRGEDLITLATRLAEYEPAQPEEA